MKKIKIIFSIYLVLFILNASVFADEGEEEESESPFEPEATFDKTQAIKDEGKAFFNPNIDSKKIIDELGFGWNLENTFDAWNSSQNQGLDSETC